MNEQSTATRPATAVAEQPQAARRSHAHVVLVTGAAGFVGTHVCRQLTNRGARVRGLVRSPAKAAERLAQLPVDVHVGDVRDDAAVRRAMQGCDTVVHLAAIAIERRGQTYDDVNAAGTQRVLDTMRARWRAPHRPHVAELCRERVTASVSSKQRHRGRRRPRQRNRLDRPSSFGDLRP